MRYNFGTSIETNQLQFAKRTQGSNDEGGASKIEINKCSVVIVTKD